MQLRSGTEILDLEDIEAFAFDLDGTLVESEPVWAAAKSAVAAAHGFEFGAEVLQGFVGRSLRAFVAEALGVTEPGMARAVAEEIEALALQGYGAKVEPIPGAARLVRELHRAGFRIAICSSASPAAIAASLDLMSLRNVVELAVSAATLPQGKPHKAPYVEVLSRLGLGPDQVIAVEDAPAGILSATAAGLSTVAVGPGSGCGEAFRCALRAERISEITLLGRPLQKTAKGTPPRCDGQRRWR